METLWHFIVDTNIGHNNTKNGINNINTNLSLDPNPWLQNA